jgi:hypothetical protein
VPSLPVDLLHERDEDVRALADWVRDPVSPPTPAVFEAIAWEAADGFRAQAVRFFPETWKSLGDAVLYGSISIALRIDNLDIRAEVLAKLLGGVDECQRKRLVAHGLVISRAAIHNVPYPGTSSAWRRT